MLEKHTGRAILMDFGLWYEKGPRATPSAAHYIARSRPSSAQAVPQSDLSLGVVLYGMLAGRSRSMTLLR